MLRFFEVCALIAAMAALLWARNRGRAGAVGLPSKMPSRLAGNGPTPPASGLDRPVLSNAVASPTAPRALVQTPRPRRLLLFGVGRLDQMMEKGNVWYCRNYEAFFDEVLVVYLSGFAERPERQGNTTLVSLGGRSDTYLLDLIVAPFRLLAAARRFRPTLYLTADQWLSWWTAAAARLLLRARIVLMPVSLPEQLYRDGGRVVPGIPFWLERRFVRWSYRAAAHVFTANAFGDFVRLLAADPLSARKLIVTDTTVEALPTTAFFDGLRAVQPVPRRGTEFRLVFVGRLAVEKLVDDLLQVMALLRRAAPPGPSYRLVLVGDGPDRPRLERLATELGVKEAVEFCGVIDNDKLPQLLSTVDVFVSTLTGTSLREAALVGLPIVAYDRDWLHGLLRDGETALLVGDRDQKAFAEAVERIAHDPSLRVRLADGARALAERLWSPAGVERSLATLHSAAATPP
jgi:glycosyltransferase involved in cell wall biosynthesis